MTSQYLKCDGCGAVLDRWPAEFNRGDGTFGKVLSREAEAYAASLGWIRPGKRFSDRHKHYCPGCAMAKRCKLCAGVGIVCWISGPPVTRLGPEHAIDGVVPTSGGTFTPVAVNDPRRGDTGECPMCSGEGYLRGEGITPG